MIKSVAMRWRLAVCLGLLTGVLVLSYLQMEQVKKAAEAYLFAYPLVMMEVTRANSDLNIVPQNQLRLVRQFPEADFHDVVRPNVDTLYSTAFIDMDQGPWVLEVAANDQRYTVLPLMDAWTNVFASLGTRTGGTGAGHYLLVAHNWQGTVPAGMTLLRAPTQLVWLIGRTQTNGVADYALVHHLQGGITLHSLKSLPLTPFRPVLNKSRAPFEQLQDMSTRDFFQRFSMSLVHNPASMEDGPMLEQLDRLGVTVGAPLRWSGLGEYRMRLGRWLADRKVAAVLKNPTGSVRGWVTPPPILGNYGTNYAVRAAVAMVGLGANQPEDAIYSSTSLDGDQQALSGQFRYRLHFAAGALPPVRAFWSVTVYGEDNYFQPNPFRRYALGDRDPLVFNSDGSLDLWLQAKQPEASKMANWLPLAPSVPFVVMARFYWPKPELLSGQWSMPAIERLQDKR